MKIVFFSFLTLILVSCNNQTQEKSINSLSDTLKDNHNDSIFIAAIIKDINDTSIINNSERTIDILFNGVDNYLGGHRNQKLSFSTECMFCEPVLVYKNGFLFGKRLYVTNDSIILFQTDCEISDTSDLIRRIGFYGQRKPKRQKFSQGILIMNYQGQSCMDADFVSVKLSYDKSAITFNKLINAFFFEFDLDKDGINEQFLMGTRNCSQELVLLRINNKVNDMKGSP